MVNTSVDISMLNAEEQQDIPDRGAGVTSSIGAAWPPQKASFNRIKGFYTPSIIASVPQFKKFLHHFSDICARASCHPEETSRVSIRALISKQIVPAASQNMEGSLEAILDLEGTSFNESLLIYLGNNDILRASLDKELEHYRTNVQVALQQSPRSASELIQRATTNQYNLRIASYRNANYNERVSTLQQMANLYARFGWKTLDVEEILNNPNNIVAIAQKGDEIVSAGIAEMAKLQIGEKILRMAEITEAATREDHSCKGLYSAVSTFLLCEIADRSYRSQFLDGEVDLVYGECNGNALGVLKTSALQGRLFSCETSARYGFPRKGILHQHVPISGAPRTTSYNDLFPTYLTKTQIYKNYSLCTNKYP